MALIPRTKHIDPTGFNNSLAVVIGIDQYSRGVPELRTAVADARRLGEVLKSEHGYEVRAFLDEDASQEALTRLFQEELHETLGPDDRLILYFAGHGVASDAADGPAGYLLPCDAKAGDLSTYLHMPGIHDELLKLECRHVLVILDSCFSGAFKWSGTRSVPNVPKVIHKERFDRFLADPAWQVISSTSHDQEAVDQLIVGTLGTRDESGQAHSPFAQMLFDALEGAGDVSRRGRGDGVVTATELYLHLEEHVQPGTTKVGQRQTPSIWPLRKHDKGEFIFLVPGHELNLPPAPELNLDNNPYRGLESYDLEHEDLFFGREDEIKELRERIEQNPLTVVLGASGTGKSSLVKAGVLPRLAKAVDVTWKLLPVVRPGAQPGAALLEALRKGLDGVTVPDPGDSLASDLQAATPSIKAWLAAHEDERLVLVIDQLEELVTLTADADGRDQVMAWIGRLLQRAEDRVRVVLTVRSDFEPSFSDTVPGVEWQQCGYPVPALDLDDFRAVIEGPAAHAVLYFDDPKLVDELIKQVNQTPGALPLLSFTLSQMYIRYVQRRSDDRALTWEDYKGLGGVIGALRTRADEEHDKVEAEQEAMRYLMLRLVASDRGGLARRRVGLSELEFPDKGQHERVHSVRKRLTDARLLVEGKDEGGEPYVEPAHDALVAAWKRLSDWRHEVDRDELANLAFRQRLATAAAEWDEDRGSKVGKGLLWRDSARASVLRRLSRRKTRARWLNQRELDFARRSIRRSSVLTWARNAAGATITALGVAAVLLGVQAVVAANRAVANGTAMIGMDLADTGVDTAMATGRLLAVEAFRSDENTETENALFQAMQELPTQLSEVAPTGAVEPGVPFGPSGAVDPTEVSFLVAALRWDPGSVVQSASQDRLALASDSLLRVFDRDATASDAPWGFGPSFERNTALVTITSTALSPDRELVAASGVGGLQVFDLHAPLLDSGILPEGASLTELTFGLDGRTIVGRAPDGSIRQFEAGGRLLYATAGATRPVRRAVFMADRHVLFFESAHDTLQQRPGPGELIHWNAGEGVQRTVAEVPSGVADVVRATDAPAANAVYWSGERLERVTVSVDGQDVSESFDLPTMLRDRGIALDDREVAMVAADPQGVLAAVLLTEAPRLRAGFNPAESGATSLAVVDLRQPPTLSDLVELDDAPDDLGFSDDGGFLVTWGSSGDRGFAAWWTVQPDGTLSSGDRADFEAPIVAGDAGSNGAAAFAEEDGTVHLWYIDDNAPWYEHTMRIELNVGYLPTAIALHQDWLAVAHSSRVRVWSADSEQPMGDDLELRLPARFVTFDAVEGDLLAGAGWENGDLRLWNFDTRFLALQICSAVGRNLTKAEGYRYLIWEEPEQYRCTCDDFPPDESVWEFGVTACPERESFIDRLIARLSTDG